MIPASTRIPKLSNYFAAFRYRTSATNTAAAAAGNTHIVTTNVMTSITTTSPSYQNRL